MLTLLIDFLKGEGITGFFTVLTENGGRLETSDVGISSLIDTWMLVRDIEVSGERNRGLYVLKSRGMNHSNQIREFILSSKGIKLVEVYLGPAGMLTGSARVALEEQERDARCGRLMRATSSLLSSNISARRWKRISKRCALNSRQIRQR